MHHARTTVRRSVAIAALAAAAVLLWTPRRGAAAVELAPIDRTMPYGAAAMTLPVPPMTNGTSPRTVQLLAEAVRRPGTAVGRRAELVADLGETKLAAAVPAVSAAAADESPVVRAEAARALATIGDAAGVEAVRKLAGDADPLVRAAAVRAGTALGDASLVPAALRDADASVVAAALAAVGAGPFAPAHADAVAAAVPTLKPGLVPAALDAIGRVGLAAVAAEATDRAPDPARPPQPGQAARDLAARHGPAVAAHAAADRPVAQRVAAVRALGRMAAGGQAQAVVAAVRDPHPVVRREAALALPAVLPPADAAARVVAMSDDPDVSVRTAAAVAVARVPSPAAIEPLVRQLADPDAPLHAAALAALIAVGEPAAAPAMAKLLDDPDPRRREDASYVLGRLKSRAGYERHVALTKDADYATAAQAGQSLGLIGDPAAGPALEALLARATAAAGDGGEHAARAMETALVSAGQIGHRPIVAAGAKLIPKGSNAPSNARAAALWTWGVLGTGDAAADDRVANLVPPILSDLMDGGDVKLEGLKALGNRKAGNAVSVARNLPQTAGAGDMLALAHWVADRTEGKVTPFDPGTGSWTADVAVADQQPPQ